MSAASHLLRPLRNATFRQLFLAGTISDIGTFMQAVGSAWLMVSLGASPLFAALTQTAPRLPFSLLALPAGAFGVIVDRRTRMLYTEPGMVVGAVALTGATVAGVMT